MPIREAVIVALSKAIPEIGSSSLTTIGGLVAMMFMQFRIGADMAICLIKSILFALLAVFVVMPGLLMLFGPLMDKTEHRNFVPKIPFVGKFAYKTRFIMPILFAIVIIIAFPISQKCPYAYGESSLETPVLNQTQIAENMISENFSSTNMLALMVPAGDYQKEAAILSELEQYEEVDYAMGIANVEAVDGYTLADQLTPREFAELAGLDYEVAQVVYATYAAEQEEYGHILGNLDSYQVPLIDMFLFVCKKKTECWIASGITIVLLVSLLFPWLTLDAKAEDGTIHIQSQNDLLKLAENCRLDAWSYDKTVILDNDIVLDERAEDFLPIPTFGGTFEGGGHTISGLSIIGEDSNVGLFDTLQQSAVVNHLKVVGQIMPNGTSNSIGGIVGANYGKLVDCSFEGAVKGDDSVGGIVGINETTGQIISCKFQGTVTGEHYVGGIVGKNTGSLIQCRNDGEINTIAVEVSANLSNISLPGTTDSVPAGTDISGIAGFSSGVIQSCTNVGNVGYEHMGYNVGGIVGRQSGYLDDCRNTGTIKGRKDVGGIVGQLEPQVTLRYNEDLLDKLWTELDTLQGLTNQATNDAQNSSSTLASNFNSLSANISATKNAVSGLSGALSDWGNKNVEQINDVSARLSWVISQTEPVLNSVSDLTSYLQTASELLQQAASKVDTTDEQGAAVVAELQQASQDLQTASKYAESCVGHLRAALELAHEILNGGQSIDAINSLLTELNAAGADAQSAKTALESSLSHISTTCGYLESIGDSGAAALEDVNAATAQLDSALTSLRTAVEQMNQIVATLSDKPAISFTPVDSSVTNQGDALDSALSQMLTNANSLSNNLTSASDTLLADMRAINNQLGIIMDLVQEEIEADKTKNASDTFEDVSDDASGEPGAGKPHNAINNGDVQGDVNVAGIVGSMSVEYDFDPEDDLTEEASHSLDFQYQTLAVVTGCTNEGSISAKKDYAGGIVGRMDLGAVKACESYGEVESTSGDYVGGIAGICRATIRNSFAKCFLAGGDYIGGIAGASEDNTVVSGCYTLVEITHGNRYTGAICGTETGEFTNNYYVSDTLAGLGRIGYTGKAEPISFEALCQVSGMPSSMTQFTLRFLVEDEEIKSYNFSYGDSFGPEVFPQIPVKDGYYASWDSQDLTNLHFDKIITAQYVRYVTTLSSDISRSSGRSVFLVDGNFDDKTTLTVAPVENSALVNGKAVAEQWHLVCSDSS